MGLKDISIRNKFILLTVVVGIFMVLIAGFGYYSAANMLGESSDGEVVATMEKAAKDMDAWFSEPIAIAKSEAVLLSTFNGDYARMKLKDNLSLGTADKNIVDVGVGLEDGTFNSYQLGLTSLNPTERGWYKDMKAAPGSAYMVTEPYVDQNTKQTLVSIVTPVKNNGNFVGAICEDIALDVLEEKIQAIKYHGEGNATFMDHEGNILATASPNLQGVKNLKDVIDTQEHFNQVMNDQSGVFVCEVNGTELVFGFATMATTNWVIGFSVPVDVVFASLHSMRIFFAVITLIGLILVLLFCRQFASSMIGPIVELEDHAKQLSEGNLKVKNIDVDSNDEIGSLTNAFNVMSNNLRKLIQKMATTAEQVAASSEELTASATQSADVSVKVAATVVEVGDDITRQMRDIEAAKNSISLVSGDIKLVADKALSVADTSEKTADAAKNGETLMQEAVEKMNSIEKSVLASAEVVEKLGENSKQIGQIVEDISGIAEQTNLLALNAAIEAARAGEHGRGFAVVSEEVRKLATASQESAEKIRTRIESIQAATEEAVMSMKSGTEDVKQGTNAIREVGIQFKEIMQMVDGIKEEIAGINQSVQTVSEGAVKIVEATESIDRASRDTDERTQSIASATQTQSASNEEIAAASQALSNLASDMQHEIGQFKI